MGFELICGPMYAGKTEELIRRVRRLKSGGKSVLIFKPKIDDRFAFMDVVSHDGNRIEAIVASSAAEIMDHLRKNKKIKNIAIDEIQFFDDYIVNLVQVLLDKGYNVIATGLDKDFRGEAFGPISALLTLAEKLTKLSAICSKCGEDAYYTQRIINGKAAPYSDEQIVVGDRDKYEARCRKHHDVPDRPDRNIF